MSTQPAIRPLPAVANWDAAPRVSQPIPLSAPDVCDDDRHRVLDVLNGRNLSLGPQLPAFEEAMAAAAGTRFAVAVNSGTSALYLALDPRLRRST